jgi:hypothetical protein
MIQERSLCDICWESKGAKKYRGPATDILNPIPWVYKNNVPQGLPKFFKGI